VVRGMPLTDRQTFSQLARNLLVSPSTVQRLFKRSHFRRHTSALKPFLIDKNKVSGVAYALAEIDGATLGAAAADGVARFMDMFDCVDIDKKGFYQTSLMVRITSWQQQNMTRWREIMKKSHTEQSATKITSQCLCVLKQGPGGTHIHTQFGMARLVFGQLDILLLHKEQASTGLQGHQHGRMKISLRLSIERYSCRKCFLPS
jgi:hypothetical protein